MAKAATGERYVLLLRDLVSDPLDQVRTSLPRGVDMPDPFIHGYQTGDGDELNNVSEFMAGGWAWASGDATSGRLHGWCG